MNAGGLHSIKAPSPADQQAYEQRVREIGFVEASFEFARKQAERLMPREAEVVDLDVEREARR